MIDVTRNTCDLTTNRGSVGSYSRPDLGGVLGILRDGDDQRIFLGLKLSISGFFWVRKFGKYFLG